MPQTTTSLTILSSSSSAATTQSAVQTSSVPVALPTKPADHGNSSSSHETAQILIIAGAIGRFRIVGNVRTVADTNI